MDYLGADKGVKKYPGKSKFNPIFEFEYKLEQRNETYLLRVTSVLGHITTIKFPDPLKDWSTTPVE